MTNTLIVGSDKGPILHNLPSRFLLIDDGPLIDALDLPKRRAVTRFDVSEHSFNPLKDMTYKRARDFISVLDAVFPEGESTLSRKNANFILLQALLAKPSRLDKLLPVPDKKDTASVDAWQKVETLLLSPVLRDVLTRPTNLSFKGTILARLDRAVLGDFDCFVLGNLLVSLYPGPVVIPDFGFYAHKGHSSLIRQNRLIAGVNTLSEVSDALRQQLLLIDEKIGSHSTIADAKVLAEYEGILPERDTYHSFIEDCIK